MISIGIAARKPMEITVQIAPFVYVQMHVSFPIMLPPIPNAPVQMSRVKTP